MDLHGKIMNLPSDGATLDWANTREAYMYGHRDARHAAAELAVAAEAEWRSQAEANAKDAARLRDLLRRALPMADALDATKTAVVWTGDLQCDASGLARDIREILRGDIDAAMTAKDPHAD